MASEKPSWAKTNVGWDIRKVVWQRWAMGDTIAATMTFFDSNMTEYKKAPFDRNTIAAVRNELGDLPIELLHKLLKELPEIETFLMKQRPDFKEKFEFLKLPQPRPSSFAPVLIPKRKIKSRTIEAKTVDGKIEVTDRIELQ